MAREVKKLRDVFTDELNRVCKKMKQKWKPFGGKVLGISSGSSRWGLAVTALGMMVLIEEELNRPTWAGGRRNLKWIFQ